jgi:hypothetical protein
MTPRFSRAWLAQATVIAAGVSVLVASVDAFAQNPPRPDPNFRQVYLIRQDYSDCTNANVPNTKGPKQMGVVSVRRGSDGNTTLKIAFAGTPNTTYHFFLKCEGLLKDITTGPDGKAEDTVIFPTSKTGNIYAFDSYPAGAPPGNKMQSAQVKF